MKLSIIIPTFNAAAYIVELLKLLISQTIFAEIIIIDSGSTDGTLQLVADYYDQVKLLRVPPDRFDHGGTRDYALRQSSGDFVLFLTQDALPADEKYIEKLLRPFSDQNIAAVCGRQTAKADAPEYEKLTREFNYPAESRIWSEKDIDRYGVKSYFFSDACSAYRRSAYEAVGGFDSPIITNEDMMIAGKFLHAGYSLCYNAEAAVYHSHRFTLKQEYERNVKIGYVMEQFKERLVGAKSDAEGIKMAEYVMVQLLKKGEIIALFQFITLLFAKFLGNRKGKQSFRKGCKRVANSVS